MSLLLILLLAVHSSEALMLSEKDDVMVVDCALHIVDAYFDPAVVTSVIGGAGAESSLTHFLRRFNGIVELGAGCFEEKQSRVALIRQFVLFVASARQLEGILHRKPRGNVSLFAVVCVDRCDADEIVKILWFNRVYDVVVLKALDQTTVSVVSYFPYCERWCAEAHASCVDRWTRKNGFDGGATLFPDKFSHFYNCEITVSAYNKPPYLIFRNGKVSGIVGDLLEALADAVNFKYVIVAPDKEAANLTLVNSIVTLDRIKTLEMTYVYHMADIVTATALPEEIHQYWKLLFVFRPLQWSAILLSYGLVAACLAILRIKSVASFWEVELNMGRSRGSFLAAWAAFIGQVVWQPPRKTFIRFLLMSWICLGLFTRTAYQSALVHFLQAELREPTPRSLDEALLNGYSFGGPRDLRRFFLYNRTLFDAYRTVSNEGLHAKLGTGDDKFVAIVAREDVLPFGSQWQIMEEKVATSPVTIYTQRFSPLARPFNRVIEELLHAGLIQKFIDEHSKIHNQTESGLRALKSLNFTGCYLLLHVGWALSGISFVVEVVVHWLKRRSLDRIHI